MLALHAGTCVHLSLGATDMRKGFDGLAAQVSGRIGGRSSCLIQHHPGKLDYLC